MAILAIDIGGTAIKYAEILDMMTPMTFVDGTKSDGAFSRQPGLPKAPKSPANPPLTFLPGWHKLSRHVYIELSVSRLRCQRERTYYAG